MAFVISAELIRSIYKPRPLDAKKYDYGHLLVVGGSVHYTGAPQLVALAAMRAGCDLATIVAPQRAADAAAGANPNLVTWPLDGDAISNRHLPKMRELVTHKTAMVIGNGAGREEGTFDALLKIMKECTMPAVIDADAIRALRKIDFEEMKGKPFVFTPHAGEFFALTGIDPAMKPFEERIEIVKQAARTLGCVVVLKGNKDIISDGQEVAVNSTGTPFMTKGGTGDVLAGIIGALLARGATPFIAAQAGCWISGKAGELAGALKGEGLLATDVIDEIPHVLLDVLT
ncbi:MAG: NAD(P)H-hydrate dehydratase [Patescibacteria group bacterium]